jgi:hypothetical protein
MNQAPLLERGDMSNQKMWIASWEITEDSFSLVTHEPNPIPQRGPFGELIPGDNIQRHWVGRGDMQYAVVKLGTEREACTNQQLEELGLIEVPAPRPKPAFTLTLNGREYEVFPK